MEPQQQHNQQQQSNEEGGSSKSNFLCRQSSSRWTPTTDQIRILKDLYYNNGVRSPTADQIQRISARLRQYGKIEGKNVFYWFQNHKARERQKKRFLTISSPDMQMQRAVNGGWRSEDNTYTKYPNGSHGAPSASSSSSSPGVVAVGQIGSYGYGSVTVEKSFRDCTISAGPVSHSFWVGADPYAPSYSFFDKRSTKEETAEEEAEDQQAPELETLPLFPMHGEDVASGFCGSKLPVPECFSAGAGGWYHSDEGKGGSRASLELSLSSYASWSSDHN
ncbi:hypothetical protein NMG60_11007867 [Bertholletia excelsa]